MSGPYSAFRWPLVPACTASITCSTACRRDRDEVSARERYYIPLLDLVLFQCPEPGDNSRLGQLAPQSPHEVARVREAAGLKIAKKRHLHAGHVEPEQVRYRNGFGRHDTRSNAVFLQKLCQHCRRCLVERSTAGNA